MGLFSSIGERYLGQQKSAPQAPAPEASAPGAQAAPASSPAPTVEAAPKKEKRAAKPEPRDPSPEEKAHPGKISTSAALLEDGEYAVVSSPQTTRKKMPKTWAYIDTEECTGCEVCREVCPTDCIVKVPGPVVAESNAYCVVEYEECTGCRLCAQMCPYEIIYMIAPEEIPLQRLFEGVERGQRGVAAA